jgi:alpha-glucosidase (family GH31 glycosyl hydrolase)
MNAAPLSFIVIVALAAGCGRSGEKPGPEGGTDAYVASSGSGSGAQGGADASGAGSDGASASSGGGSGGSSSGAAGSGGNSGGSSGSACAGSGAPVPAAERVSNGNPVLPPKWAFGVLWGSYYDQTGSTFAQGGNLLDAATRVRAEYSGDLMWIDSSWLWHDYASATTGQYYICFQFDPMVFPDPGTMIQTLRQNHFHFGVWEWPWMGHGCQYFQAGVTNKYFVMNGAQPATTTGAWHGDTNPAAFDFTNPAAVTWWTGLNKPMTDWGLDFFKLDTNDTQLNSATVSGGGTLADPTKSYAHEYHRAAYEATKAYSLAHDPVAMMNGARGFIMPKTPSPANVQLPGYWTDDTTATFAGMLSQDMSRASQLDTPTTSAYWCGDTGGYSGTPTDELYIRWLEYSTFTPLQEFFGAKTGGFGARFPWLFGTQAQQIQKQYTQLRYRLLPFRYSNALIAYQVTPAAYPVTWIGSTQILVGSGSSQMLVQPITTAGATTASVTLPPGTWIHYWTGTPYTGTAMVAAPIDQEPIFVKAGSIIPMGPPLRWVDEVPADPLTLDIYPAGSTSYTLYEDDGISEGYMGGAYSTTKLSSDDTTGKVVIAIGAQATAKYAYAGQLCSRTYILKINGRAVAPATVTRDGNAVPLSSAAAFSMAPEGWYYDATAQTVWVKFPLLSSASTSVSL